MFLISFLCQLIVCLVVGERIHPHMHLGIRLRCLWQPMLMILVACIWPAVLCYGMQIIPRTTRPRKLNLNQSLAVALRLIFSLTPWPNYGDPDNPPPHDPDNPEPQPGFRTKRRSSNPPLQSASKSPSKASSVRTGRLGPGMSQL